MTKFSLEEKKKAVELVKNGASLGAVVRQTGISTTVIRNVLNQTELHGWEAR